MNGIFYVVLTCLLMLEHISGPRRVDFLIYIVFLLNLSQRKFFIFNQTGKFLNRIKRQRAGTLSAEKNVPFHVRYFTMDTNPQKCRRFRIWGQEECHLPAPSIHHSNCSTPSTPILPTYSSALYIFWYSQHILVLSTHSDTPYTFWCSLHILILPTYCCLLA